MKKVLIISPSSDEQNMIEEVAQHHNPGGLFVETTASFGQDADWWKNNGPDVLVIHLPNDDLQSYYFTKIRRDLPKTQAIVFLCATISPELMQMSLNFTKIRMIKTPVEEFSFYRAVLDLMREFEPGQQQVHPRYLTDQSVEILSDFHEGKIVALMKNLSLSGAYFESEKRDFELAMGDHIKMSVMVGQPPRQYVFDAKVVWVKPQQTLGVIGYGITFIDKEEVYNHLLKNM